MQVCKGGISFKVWDKEPWANLLKAQEVCARGKASDKL